MSKKTYLGDDNSIARKVKKWYLGDTDSKARKVKKAYIGVGGVARPFFSGNGVEYYGTTSSLSLAKQYLATASIGDYALIAGGGTSGSVNSAAVDVYNSKLVKSVAEDLSVGRRTYATTIGNYALFGGGADNSNWYSNVDAYDASLVHTTATDLTYKREQIATASVSNQYALFVGGRYKNSSSDTSYTATKYIDAYNASLVRTKKNLTSALTSLLGASVEDYGLFVKTSSAFSINSSLVQATLTAPSSGYVAGNEYHSFLSAEDNAVLISGSSSSGMFTEVYNSSLVKTIITSISEVRIAFGAAYINGYCLIAGGNPYTAAVEYYDPNFVLSTTTDLSVARLGLIGATTGDYALFAGGFKSGGCVSTVDVYEVTA